MTRRERIVVTAAVVERDGAFLLTRRLHGTHLAGHWEFPGGKLHAGETLLECLAREIREELDAEVEIGPEILSTVHDYANRSVELHFFRCALRSAPRPTMGQGMQWVLLRDLPSVRLPPADDELVQSLMRSGVSRRG
jgi:8-oxo-dGTP diphosphatase